MSTNDYNRSSLIPRGTLSEKLAGKKRGRFFVSISVIVAIHCAVVAAMLIQGCSRTSDTPAQPTDSISATSTNEITGVDSGFYEGFPDKQASLTNAPVSVPNPIVPGTQTNVVNPLPTTIQPILPVATNEPPPIGTQTLSPTSNVVASIPASTATTASSTDMKEHTVVSGDSFYKIAQTYGVTVKAIEDANPSVSSTKLRLGQKIKIPAVPEKAAGAIADATATAKNEVEKHENGTSYTDPSSNVTYYWVKGGDNLGKIAKKFGVSAKEIQTLNRLSSPNVIRVGQRLQIPEKKAATSVPTATEPVAASSNPVSTPVNTTNDLIKTQL